MKKLQGKKVAILATDGFEESELMEPKKAMENAGANVEIVSLEDRMIKGWKDGSWSNEIKVDCTISKAMNNNYDALMLPGGVINPDKLRNDEDAVNFVRGFFNDGKPVAAICHAPQLLIEADVVKNRTLTSYSSIKTDLKNAGANWKNESVVVDAGLVTSQSPEDLDDFKSKLIEEIREGKHKEQTV